ncbi:hypothetical protein MYOV085v1_p0137 [Vibrio phage 355E48.1]|nr:hypothetical protein MYOV085v1_p0137 [Vibrio phage 355E48.1]
MLCVLIGRMLLIRQITTLPNYGSHRNQEEPVTLKFTVVLGYYLSPPIYSALGVTLVCSYPRHYSRKEPL